MLRVPARRTARLVAKRTLLRGRASHSVVGLCFWAGRFLAAAETMPQSSKLASGSGFTFEDQVSGEYLSALLAEAFAPGTEDRIVVKVALQQRDFGEPLDDLIVDAQGADGSRARLSLQVKSSLVISAAESNTDFRDVVRDSWVTFLKSDFRTGVDRYGAVVGRVAKEKARAILSLTEMARNSIDLAHFQQRFSPSENASQVVRTVRDDVATVLEGVVGRPT